MAHGKGDVHTAVDIAVAAAHGTAAVDETLRMIYSDIIMLALGKAARKAFQMDPRTYQPRSEPFRKWYQKGLAEARALDVIDVLTARGLSVDASQRERIVACTDLAELSRWIRRAVTVETTEGLFEDE